MDVKKENMNVFTDREREKGTKKIRSIKVERCVLPCR